MGENLPPVPKLQIGSDYDAEGRETLSREVSGKFLSSKQRKWYKMKPTEVNQTIQKDRVIPQ